MLLLRVLFYNSLLIGACGYAWTGGRRAHDGSNLCACAGRQLRAGNELRFSRLELGVLAVDLATAGVFVAVALRSERLWPLWVSGLQLTSSVTHLLKAVQPKLMPFAYAAAQAIWSYPILIILAVATW